MVATNPHSTKQCPSCKAFLPKTRTYFYINNALPDKLSRNCKGCTRKNREREGHREKARERGRAYRRTAQGRAVSMLRAYKNRDACDYTVEEMMEALEKPCVYCGTDVENRGLDRLDNGRGHTKDNTVPACFTCNKTRSDTYTPDEMKMLGVVVASIRSRRQTALEPD